MNGPGTGGGVSPRAMEVDAADGAVCVFGRAVAGVGPDSRETLPAGRDIAPATVVLLGTGNVGRAVLERLHALRAMPHKCQLELRAVANTRACWTARDRSPSPPGRGVGERVRSTLQPDAQVLHPSLVGSVPVPGASLPRRTLSPASLPEEAGLARLLDAFQLTGDASDFDTRDTTRIDRIVGSLPPDGPRIVIDATPSAAVARRHARWLASGIHVVTACKLARGTSLRRWHAIEYARRVGGTHYGAAATVGAGLPLLSTLRALRDGGERIHGISGVLSGSLAWLLHAFDGSRPFSALVAEAREAGYTEPDPREDLCGADVRRKLLILARAAGAPLRERDVAVQSLVPACLPAGAGEADDWRALDAPMARQLHAARAQGRVLRFVARWHADGARVGLEALAPDHPLAQGGACDNRVAIHSDRYRTRPLVIQGPGAGAAVTAVALLDDTLAIAQATRGHALH